MTRLRFILNDESIVDDSAVSEIPGVLGVVRNGGQYQVVVGNNVAKCFAEINKLSAHSEQNTAAKAKAKRRPVAAALDFIADCMTQLIPVIIAGGLIKATACRVRRELSEPAFRFV